MGKIKEYLFGIAQDIHDGEFIDHEDLQYDGSKHDDRVIDAGIHAYISREAEDDEMHRFLQSHTGALLDMVKDIMGIGPDEPESDEDWTDPAGGRHYGDEEDPARMYEGIEMPKLFEDDRDPSGKLDYWLSNVAQILEDHMAYTRQEAFYLCQISDYILSGMYQNGVSPMQAAKEIANDEDLNNELGRWIADEEYFTKYSEDPSDDYSYGEYTPKKAKEIKKEPKKPAKPAVDYSKMKNWEIKKEVDAALDAGDTEKLKELSKYIKENAVEMPSLLEWWGTAAASLGSRAKKFFKAGNRDKPSGDKNEWKKHVKPERWESSEKPAEEEDPLADVYSIGKEVLQLFHELGFEDAKLSGLGRKKKAARFAIDCEHGEHNFTVFPDGEIYYDGTFEEEWEDWNIGNLQKNKPVVKKNLEEILV